MQIPLARRRSLWAQLRLLLQYREMLLLWTGRELRSRYRQSVLGVGWALVQPLVQMVVLTVVFGLFIKVPSEGFPYPVFLYTGLLPWLLFAGSVSTAVPSVTANMPLVGKIYFPREILPLSAILTRFVDFLIASLIFIALMIYYRMPLHSTLLYVPLLLALQIALSIGISLLGAAVTVFLRDISFALPVLMQLWMYATPVIYPIRSVPAKWQPLIVLNPMAGIIDSYRRVVLMGEPPDLRYLGIATALTIALCYFAYSYFKKLELAMSDVL